jgi:hypothetical protein
MEKLIRKYWKGWLSGKNARASEDYWQHWEQVSDDADAAGYDLVIFRIPRKKGVSLDGEAIEGIERFLQHKYGK